MKVEVLGTGCANCKRTVQLVEDVAREQGVAIDLVKVDELPKIIAYGVMSTPAVVVDGEVVHAGGVPTREKIGQWLAAAATAAPCCAPQAATAPGR
ncbi:MAG: thioredoxin family protein [Burkholderiaceae bacterium]|jgi:small redox-active disulfide protein 2|nr:thioredoxin family protein [Burkholderiaceae bacterium]